MAGELEQSHWWKTPERSQLYGGGAPAEEAGDNKDCWPVIGAERSATKLLGETSKEPKAGPSSLLLKMAEDREHMSEKIWSHTLEIICLLTGETFPIVFGDHVTMAVSPPPSWTFERFIMQKILEVSQKITDLLIGEIGIKEDELVVEASSHTGVIIKVEPSSCSVTPERPPLGQYGVGAAEEETILRNVEQNRYEKSYPVIGEGCQQKRLFPEVSEDFTEDDLAERISSYTKCDKSNFQKFELHEKANPKKRIFSCAEGGYILPSKSKLASDVIVYSVEKPYSCSECGKCFTKKGILNNHIKVVHSGVKPYSCIECGKCFTKKSHLVTHEMVHSGERPYSCNECGKSFSKKSNLNKHESVHTGEKPYSCNACGKCFSQKAVLVIHEIIHTGEKPYTCLLCGKSFTQKSAAKFHHMIHTGEKPYSCSECGKCFYRRSDLVRHKIVHTGAKPYSSLFPSATWS